MKFCIYYIPFAFMNFFFYYIPYYTFRIFVLLKVNIREITLLKRQGDSPLYGPDYICAITDCFIARF